MTRYPQLSSVGLRRHEVGYIWKNCLLYNQLLKVQFSSESEKNLWKVAPMLEEVPRELRDHSLTPLPALFSLSASCIWMKSECQLPVPATMHPLTNDVMHATTDRLYPFEPISQNKTCWLFFNQAVLSQQEEILGVGTGLFVSLLSL